jgi:hypothetical protein
VSSFIKNHIVAIILGVALVVVLVACAIKMDSSDRDFLCKEIGVDRSEIHREFFHASGRDVRVYYINGNKWIVTGLFYLEASCVTHYGF